MAAGESRAVAAFALDVYKDLANPSCLAAENSHPREGSHDDPIVHRKQLESELETTQ
jgi:hypothetical protein